MGGTMHLHDGRHDGLLDASARWAARWAPRCICVAICTMGATMHLCCNLHDGRRAVLLPVATFLLPVATFLRARCIPAACPTPARLCGGCRAGWKGRPRRGGRATAWHCSSLERRAERGSLRGGMLWPGRWAGRERSPRRNSGSHSNILVHILARNTF